MKTKEPVWKTRLRSVLPWKAYWMLKSVRAEWRALWSDHKLQSLAVIYNTDKGIHHNYMPVYEVWLGPLRHQPVRLLEIGIGGYAKEKWGGDSLRMWRNYFKNGIITGIDIYDKSALAEKRIHIYQGDQTDAAFLQKVSEKEGPFDIIIDDGSHVQSHVIASFEALFPLLKAGGLYVIEDTQTSYWPKYEGSTSELNTVRSSMNYFTNRIHQVNRTEWIQNDLKDQIPDDGIDSIAFYHNLIVIRKK
jgi:cephalosporin hydroxylase